MVPSTSNIIALRCHLIAIVMLDEDPAERLSTSKRTKTGGRAAGLVPEVGGYPRERGGQHAPQTTWLRTLARRVT